MEPTLDEIQKLLMLINFLGVQGLSLALGPLLDAEGSVTKANQKQSQVERLRKELDEQISSHLANQLPNERQVKILMLMSHIGHGIDAMCREAVKIGELTYGPAPSRKVRKRVGELFETACDALNDAITAFTHRGTPACMKALNLAEVKGERLAQLLERLRDIEGTDAALIAAVSRVAIQAQALTEEIGAFLAAFTSEVPEASPNRLRVGRS